MFLIFSIFLNVELFYSSDFRRRLRLFYLSYLLILHIDSIITQLIQIDLANASGNVRYIILTYKNFPLKNQLLLIMNFASKDTLFVIVHLFKVVKFAARVFLLNAKG